MVARERQAASDGDARAGEDGGGQGLRLLLVEDDRLLADLLAAELAALGYAVQVVENGAAALTAVFESSFDAIILDRMLPRVDGVEILEKLRAEQLTMPVILMTALGRLPEKLEGLAAGADDYVVKPVAAAELHARLGAILRGRTWTVGAGEVIQAGEIKVSPARFRAWRNDRPLALSKLEFHLLAELARSWNSVVTRKMLLERVWNYDFEPTANIVDAHIRRLRKALIAEGEADPITTVRGVGYMLCS